MRRDIETLGYTVAKNAHGDQTYGVDDPYVDVHCREVVVILATFGFDTDEWINAGWLHDSVEDTDLTIEEVRVQFGDLTTDLVWAVTGIGENRKARVADMHNKVLVYPDAAVLKAADRIHNAESAKTLKDQRLFQMYQKEYPAFRSLVLGLIPNEMLERLDLAHR